MPPKPISTASIPPPKPQLLSAAVKAAATASKATGVGGSGTGGGNPSVNIIKQPPKKKKTVTKAKRPGSSSSTVVIGRNDTLLPKIGVMKNKSNASTAAESVKFSSQIKSKHSNSSKGNSKPNTSTSQLPISTSASQLQQFKIEKAQIAKRELAEMDFIERAFREDESVWAGPGNVVFPRRYHAGDNDESQSLFNKEDGDSKNKKGQSNIDNPHMAYYYGSQSQGWMYGEGLAGIGGRSWMEASNAAADNDEKKKDVDKLKTIAPNDTKITTTACKSDDTNNKPSSFLMDDVTIIDNALKANGLTRNDVTPKAYACFLEQSRRYALELLANAQDYAIHAQRNTIPALLPADLLLAVEMHQDNNGGVHGVSSTLPTPEQIADLANEVNRAPLPPIPGHCYNGVALPPVEEQLTSRTYDVVNGARVVQRMMRGGDLPSTSGESGVSGLAKKHVAVGSSSSSSLKKKIVGSYGSGKGRQIAVQLKSKTPGSPNAASSSLSEKCDSSVGVVTALASSKPSSATKSGSKKWQKRTLTEL